MSNCFYIMAIMRHLHQFIPSLDVVGEPGKRHARRPDKTQVVSDWLNTNSLGIMSAFSYIEYLA